MFLSDDFKKGEKSLVNKCKADLVNWKNDKVGDVGIRVGFLELLLMGVIRVDSLALVVLLHKPLSNLKEDDDE